MGYQLWYLVHRAQAMQGGEGAGSYGGLRSHSIASLKQFHVVNTLIYT